jgi:hypothetical protein
MKFTRFQKITAGTAVAVCTVLAVSLMAVAIPASAQSGRVGKLHVVKDCITFSGIPGSSYCEITSSNLPELPAGARIYYDQITDGPTAGTKGFLDSTIFVYVSDSHWAVGRCTLANDNQSPGLCTLSDGVGPLAGFSARIVVTYTPGSDPTTWYLYAWDGTYSFNPLAGR